MSHFDALEVGDRVWSERFGFGTVTSKKKSDVVVSLDKRYEPAWLYELIIPEDGFLPINEFCGFFFYHAVSDTTEGMLSALRHKSCYKRANSLTEYEEEKVLEQVYRILRGET